MSNLSCKDLMVGDLVGYGQRRKAVVVWFGTDRCRILVGSIAGDEIVEETYDNIDPISLTPEILEKNGFNKESDFRWSVPGIKKYSLVNEKVFDGPDSWWFCFNVPDKHKLGHICLFECGNVHELQHILKSGKSNIKIEL